MMLYWKIWGSVVLGLWLVGLVTYIPVELCDGDGEAWLKGCLIGGAFLGVIGGLLGLMLQLWV